MEPNSLPSGMPSTGGQYPTGSGPLPAGQQSFYGPSPSAASPWQSPAGAQAFSQQQGQYTMNLSQQQSPAPGQAANYAAPQPLPSQPVPQPAPVAPMPMAPPLIQPVTQQPPQPTAAEELEAGEDVDVIEKEWVDKAKEIIAATKEDPHAQEAQLSQLQAIYLKKRYGKDVAVPEV